MPFPRRVPFPFRRWRPSRHRLVALLLVTWVGWMPLATLADSLDDLRQRGRLRWGADAEGGAPYVFPDPADPQRLIGFEVELAAALAERLGVVPEFVQNSWDGLVPALQRGNFDVILNGLEVTPERTAEVDFTRPYYRYAQQIVVDERTHNVRALADLAGRAVGVLAASAAQRVVEAAGNIDVRIYPGNVESFRDLHLGRIDAVVLDRPIALHYLKEDRALRNAGPPFAHGYYGMAVRRGETRLLLALNQALADVIQSGTLQRIYARYDLWDSDQEPLSTALGAAEATQVPPSSLPGRVSTWREWRRYLPILLRGAVVTAQISFLGMLLAIALGLALALTKLYAPAPLRWVATGYIEVIRGTPLLIQLYLIYYGLPNLGLRLDAFTAAVLGLGLNYAAYEAENYRAGLRAIPPGQMEAALALGMTHGQGLRRIILPQALRIMTPPMTNDFIALFKDSSLVSVITLVELTKAYGMLAMSTFDYLGLGLMTAALYLGLSLPVAAVVHRLEKRWRHDLH